MGGGVRAVAPGRPAAVRRPEDGGLHLDQVAALCSLPPEHVAEHTELPVL